jgi:2-polyprenyl-3-methyl-5-hydroxy-6-metoxy-1,4-benzoquinol methylase
MGAVTACHVCGSPELEQLVQKATPFRLVSSDVQAVIGRAEYSLCSNCLTVQKTATPAWQAMAERIYANYNINHQSQGAEPTIFDSAKGSGPRSLMLLRNFLDTGDLAEEGRLLDFGCSNGNLLTSFHGLRPRWRLSGAELVDQWKETVLALPGVEAFYSGADPAFAGGFDVISLSHVLEHIPDPIPFLRAFSGHLAPGGRILLAMPNLRQNSSDLIIADHCSHFDEDSLAYVVGKAGFGIELLSSTMLPKELVAVLSLRRPARVPDVAGAEADARRASTKARCLFYFELLDSVRRTARACAREGRPFGIMGSSIAACWTQLELEGRADFFVDEDRNRIGHRLMDRPIVAPAETPAGALVFIPMSVAVAEKIIERWRQLPVDFRYEPTNQPGQSGTG